MVALVSPGQVRAQDEPLTDAQRIEQIRNQSAQQVQSPEPNPGSSLVGEDTAATVEPALPEYANDQLPLGTSEASLLDEDSERSSSSGLGDGWVMSTLAALGIVLALVYGIRWLLRRGGVVTKAAPQGAVVEVLSRTTVAPRSHVVLMRIGSRILIVNDSTSGMRTLATVDDPEEVADLLGALDASKASSLTENFNGVMKKLSGQWSSSDEQDLGVDPDAKMDDGVGLDHARGVVSSVRGRLAALSGSGGKA